MVNKIDFNSGAVVECSLDVLQGLVADRSYYRPIRVKNGIYFDLLEGRLPAEAGWYVLLDAGVALYVGKADNLDRRLNSDDGSRDNFANPKRASDPERNFVKNH